MVLWGVSAALAAPVELTRDGNVIRGTTELEVPAPALIELVRDPVRVGAASGSDMRYIRLDPVAGCDVLEVAIPTFLGRIGGEVRACDTPTGSSVVMTRSSQFKTYRYAWTVEALDETRSRLTYEMTIALSLPVPASFLWKSTSDGIRDSLATLQSWRP